LKKVPTMSKIRHPRILVVDDEPGVIRALQASLEANGFEILTATDGSEALEVIDKELPDLLILDIIMPKMDGFEVCRRVRQRSEIPIIMLSARQSEEDKVQCLNLGSDDYISKPFSMNEVVARVKAVLRRTTRIDTTSAQPSFTCGSLTIDFAKRRVTIAGNEVRLTPTEFSLLQELTLNADKVLTHTHLLKTVWGPEYGQEREYLRVFVGRLRAKLEPNPLDPKYIVTVPGVGYKFQALHK
ncbi:unnamed protein product, partial [marine sediment metagenome]